MKNIFILIQFLIFIPLIGMDPFKGPHEERRKMGIISGGTPKPIIFPNPPLDGWTTSIGATTIFVTTGKLRNASGFVDILAGTSSDLLEEWDCISSSPNNNRYPIRYSRYGYSHKKEKHKEGVLVFSECHPDTQKLKKWQAIELIDSADDKRIKENLHWLYTETLNYMKKKHLHANSIALSSIGTKLGFPTAMTIPVATKAIGEFIEKNPNAYIDIILCVKKQSLVMQYIQCIEKFKQYRALQAIFD